MGVSSSFSGGNPGSCLNLWYDCRPGGAQIAGNRWIRCHFGVKNGYHSGIDGYGIGTTILCQGSPSTHSTSNPADEGPNANGGSTITSANWNPRFDWSQVDHCATDNSFVDCLFEYATWYPMDLCDARPLLLDVAGRQELPCQEPGRHQHRRQRRRGLG